jgi:hypothetical protein
LTSQRKIEDWKLDDSVRHIYGLYQSTKFPIKNVKLDFNSLSFEEPKIGSFGPYSYAIRGDLKLFNTIEEYNAADLKEICGEKFET